MPYILLKNATVVNEGATFQSDILIKNKRIERIDSHITPNSEMEVIDLNGKYVLPGVIDDQVHFREPGLTHKATIATESMAAVAGGTTSFMEMPNTKPSTTDQEQLELKYQTASKTAFCNYSFYFGASNDNLEEVLKTNPYNVCGIKIFMGSSTGNMLVDNEKILDGLFSKVPMLIATHCEDEHTIMENLEKMKDKVPESEFHARLHPIIRDARGCYLSSSKAVELAKKYDTRLHILHISTKGEIGLFDNTIPLEKKRITSEVCVHHLWFDDRQYDTMGNHLKCNPAVKTPEDRAALLEAIKDNHFDVIATDHAPHTIEEKSKPYLNAPAGLPTIQHSLLMMLDFVNRGELTMETVARKMSHDVAKCFKIKDRGYIREGYFADLVVIDPDRKTHVRNEDVYYKCGWTPMAGYTFRNAIDKTFVNGQLVYNGSQIIGQSGDRLYFEGHQ